MEIICEQCESRFNLADEKVPKGKVLRLNCPKCRNAITLNGSADEPPKKQRLKPGPAKTVEDEYDLSDYGGETELVYYNPDIRLALILVGNPEQEAKVKKSLESMAYQGIVAPNTRDALGKIRFHNFLLIILADNFDGQKLGNSPIINYLNRLSIAVRRRIFLVIVHDQFKTMDNMMAFTHSANLVINSKELDQIALVLEAAISENEKFYKVFNEMLRETGKA